VEVRGEGKAMKATVMRGRRGRMGRRERRERGLR
jgi:hypothetical protein